MVQLCLHMLKSGELAECRTQSFECRRCTARLQPSQCPCLQCCLDAGLIAHLQELCKTLTSSITAASRTSAASGPSQCRGRVRSEQPQQAAMLSALTTSAGWLLTCIAGVWPHNHPYWPPALQPAVPILADMYVTALRSEAVIHCSNDSFISVLGNIMGTANVQTGDVEVQDASRVRTILCCSSTPWTPPSWHCVRQRVSRLQQ